MAETVQVVVSQEVSMEEREAEQYPFLSCLIFLRAMRCQHLMLKKAQMDEDYKEHIASASRSFQIRVSQVIHIAGFELALTWLIPFLESRSI